MPVIVGYASAAMVAMMASTKISSSSVYALRGCTAFPLALLRGLGASCWQVIYCGTARSGTEEPTERLHAKLRAAALGPTKPVRSASVSLALDLLHPIADWPVGPANPDVGGQTFVPPTIC